MNKLYKTTDSEVAPAARYAREVVRSMNQVLDLLANAEGFRARDVGDRLRSLAELADNTLAELVRGRVRPGRMWLGHR